MRKVTQAELDDRAALAAEIAAEAKAMRELAETDWYVIRYLEAGTPVPEDVTARREAARVDASDARAKRLQREGRGQPRPDAV